MEVETRRDCRLFTLSLEGDLVTFVVSDLSFLRWLLMQVDLVREDTGGELVVVEIDLLLEFLRDHRFQRSGQIFLWTSNRRGLLRSGRTDIRQGIVAFEMTNSFDNGL